MVHVYPRLKHYWICFILQMCCYIYCIYEILAFACGHKINVCCSSVDGRVFFSNIELCTSERWHFVEGAQMQRNVIRL